MRDLETKCQIVENTTDLGFINNELNWVCHKKQKEEKGERLGFGGWYFRLMNTIHLFIPPTP